MATRRRDRQPHQCTLDEATLDDEKKLAAAIERVLRSDPEHQALNDELRARQEDLHQAVSDDAWQVYLQVEETAVARTTTACDALVRWAFEAGVRHGRGQR